MGKEVLLSGRAFTLRVATLLMFLAGLGLLAWLVARQGVEPMVAAVSSAGWGLLAVVAYRATNLIPDAMGWRVLFNPATRPPLVPLLVFRGICESINNLLPVAQVGGDLERARLAAQLTGNGPEAGATVLADFTTGILAQIIYGFLGVALLAVTKHGAVSGGIVLGLVIAAALVGAFWVVQQLGLFRRLAGLARRVLRGPGWESLSGTAEGFERAIAEVYGRRRQLLIGGGLRLLAWTLHAGETWIALKVLGSSAGLVEAFILDSLTAAARSAAFMIPGGLGIQDGAFMVLGAQLGLSPEMSLSLALVKRVREVISGVPGLITWAIINGRGLAMKSQVAGSRQSLEVDG
jgi:putative membrane protein